MATTPALGYGTRGEAPINAVNQWMRGQPWYQTLLQSFGQTPNNVHLNDSQKQQVIRAAQAQGVIVDEGHDGQEIDDSGNFQAKGHKLRNTLIVAGIAGAALATMGAAGVFSGAAGAGGAAAGGGGAAAAGGGTLASTVLGTGAIGPIAGGAGLAGGGGAAAAGGGALAAAGHFLASPGGSTLASTLGGVFTNVYGANKAADAARYGVDAQTKAANYAADLNDAAAQRAEAFSREQAETGWQSGERNQRANYDQWAARQRAITGSLGQQLGINYQIPDYVAGVDPRFTGGGAPPGASGAPAASGGSAAELKALLDGGADPQQAVAQFNQRFGRTTGNEAKYYDPSQHGGVATIGLPDAYLSLEPSGWGVTTRGAAAAPAPRQTLATFVNPAFLPYRSTTPVPSPYQPGTLGAYMGRA